MCTCIGFYVLATAANNIIMGTSSQYSIITDIHVTVMFSSVTTLVCQIALTLGHIDY